MSRSNSTFHPFQTLIFDMDGVIIDTVALHYQSWRQITREEGLPFSRRTNDRLRGLSRRDSLAILFEGRPLPNPEGIDELLQRKNLYFLELAAAITPRDLLPGILRLMKQARDLALRIAVASSSQNVSFILAQLQISSLFDVIVDGHNVKQAKPDPALFLLAALKLGVPPKSCIVIEDAPAGIQAAQAAGMLVLGVGPAKLVREADYSFQSAVDIDLNAILAGSAARKGVIKDDR